MTGLAIMVRALRRFGVDAEPYVPSRLDEGHGLSLRAVDAAEAAGRSLIVTVDTGSTSGLEIAEASAAGDRRHRHRPSPAASELPPAVVALVNPHRVDSTYPDPTAGRQRGRIQGRPARSSPAFPAVPMRALALAELATIGTVADVAPILGENRAIARLGLDRLRIAPLPGLAAMLELAGAAPASVDLETVAFVIAPRLNAAGRVGDALEAAQPVADR